MGVPPPPPPRGKGFWGVSSITDIQIYHHRKIRDYSITVTQQIFVIVILFKHFFTTVVRTGNIVIYRKILYVRFAWFSSRLCTWNIAISKNVISGFCHCYIGVLSHTFCFNFYRDIRCYNVNIVISGIVMMGFHCKMPTNVLVFSSTSPNPNRRTLQLEIRRDLRSSSMRKECMHINIWEMLKV